MSRTPGPVPGRAAVPAPVALLCGASLGALALAVGLTPLSNNDIWLHLTTGRLILERGAVPVADVYSFTRAGAPYVPHEWLAQVLFVLVHRWLGVTGLILLKPIALAAAAAFVWAAARRLGGGRVACLWAAVAAIAAMASHLFTRPHLATFVILPAVSWLLARRRAGDGWTLAPLLVAQILWANLHGGFLLGIALAAALGAWTAAAAMAAASLANPSGWGLYRFALVFVDPVFRREIREWSGPFQEPFLGSFHFWILVFLLAAALVSASFFVRHGRPGPAAALVLAAGLAIASKRHASVLGLIAAPWAAAAWTEAAGRRGAAGSDRSPARGAAPSRGLAASCAVVLLMAGAAAATGVPHETGRLRRAGLGLGPNVPVAALDDAVARGLEGRALTSFGFGSYVAYRAWPATRVFIDSRLDVYGGPFIEEYLAAMADAGRMRALLRRYPVDYAVLSYRLEVVEGAVTALSADPSWALVYYDDVAMVYARRQERWIPFIDRDAYVTTNPYLFLSGRLSFAGAADAAIREADRALSRSPASRVARLMKGTALQAAGRHREAAAILEVAAAGLEPGDEGRPLVLGLLGTSYAALGDDARAEAAFRDLLALAPDSAFARRMLEEIGSRRRR